MIRHTPTEPVQLRPASPPLIRPAKGDLKRADMLRWWLLSYYPLMALLVFVNSCLEAHFGASRATWAAEAVLGCAIFLPLVIPIFLNFVAVLGPWP
jgi:hypothetical protein